MPHLTRFSGTCRYIVTDVDQTFLTTSKKLVPRNIEAIRKAQNAGITVAIASGRYWPSGKAMLENLVTLTGPQVLDNGAVVLDATTEKIHNVTLLDPDTCRFFVHKIESYGFIPMIGTPMVYYVPWINDDLEYQLSLHLESAQICNSTEEMLEQHIHETVKTVFYSPNDDAKLRVIVPEINAEAERLGMKFTSVFTENGINVTTPPGINKLTGIKQACQILGCDLCDVAAVGDGDNDAEMLSCCGLGFAVANATAAAKDAASHHVCSNNDGGFAEAVDRILAGDL